MIISTANLITLKIIKINNNKVIKNKIKLKIMRADLINIHWRRVEDNLLSGILNLFLIIIIKLKRNKA
jgi:hypothetical protein